MEFYGRVTQLGEHLLCKHAFISLKSLNRSVFTVQTPLQVGLLIGLQKVRVLCDSLKHPRPGRSQEYPGRFTSYLPRAPPKFQSTQAFIGSNLPTRRHYYRFARHLRGTWPVTPVTRHRIRELETMLHSRTTLCRGVRCTLLANVFSRE
jgi:hypothetical protein